MDNFLIALYILGMYQLIKWAFKLAKKINYFFTVWKENREWNKMKGDLFK
jgi:hypothetical protein